MNNVKDWWNSAAEDYQREFDLTVDIHYGPSTPNEDELNLLGEVSGKNILELGCGGAQCSVAFAKRGANVIGMDFSSEQLLFARSLANKNSVDIKLIEHDISDLAPIDTSSQDIVFSAFALLYIENRKNVFEETFRVLKPGGQFVFSLDHPFYRKIDPETLVMHESYFLDEKLVDDWGDFGTTDFFPYTIADLLNLLVETGFQIKKLIEPDSRIRYDYDPWFGLYDIYTPKLLDMVPPTIVYQSVKP